MQTAYEHTTESHQVGPADHPPLGPRPEYVKTRNGLLKIAEVVLCILMLICASVVYWSHLGGGWVQFVAASGFLATAILFIFHFLNIVPRIPGPWLFIEFLYYCIFCLLLIIAAIVCSVRAHLHDAIGAATFFNFAALIVFAIDTFFHYREWQFNQHSHTTAAQATTTTTTTTYETKTQY